MSLSNTIKAIQNIMRKDAGVDGDAQRVGQLGWMLFLKIYSDLELETELEDANYKSPIPVEFRWESWADETSAGKDSRTGDSLINFVNNELFPQLKELDLSAFSGQARERGALLISVFDDAYNYMKNGTLLRQVINKINQDIDYNSAETRHLFGDIYEQILRDLQNAGNAGEYYTPRAVTQFAIEMINPQLGEVVLDPACGTGGFLTGAFEHMKKQVKNPAELRSIKNSIRGVEKKPLPHVLCATNMMIHGIEVPSNIINDNTLAKPLRDYGESDQVDVIITNPPFGGVEEDGIENNFPAEFRTKETADLFLLLVMDLLKGGGRAAIVLPDGTLFGEGVKTKIKKKMLEECNLHTIVRLPGTVFAPYTGIATNVLFLTKGEPTSDIWYFEHRFPEGVQAYSKTKPMRLEEFDVERSWWSDRQETQQAWKVSVADIARNNYNLDIKNPNSPTEVHDDPEASSAIYLEAVEAVRESQVLLNSTLGKSLEVKEDAAWGLIQDNWATFTGTPQRLSDLRRLILTLASRGLLLPPNLSEESPPFDKVSGDWDLPKNWIWCELEAVSDYGGSGTVKPSSIPPDCWVLDLEDIEKTTSKLLTRSLGADRKTTSNKACFDKGDVLYGKLRPYLDKVLVADMPGFCTTEIVPIRPKPGLDPRWLRICLKRPDFVQKVTESSYGTKMPRLGAKDAKASIHPIPPHQEQRRLVEHVDRLFEICDQLERDLVRADSLGGKLTRSVVWAFSGHTAV